MQDDAYYMVDDSGMEVALGGLNATLRDYAKFGLLYLNRAIGMAIKWYLQSG